MHGFLPRPASRAPRQWRRQRPKAGPRAGRSARIGGASAAAKGTRDRDEDCLGARLPFDGEPQEYQGRLSESGGQAMTIASVLRGKGSQVEIVTAEDRLYDAVRRLGEQRIGA